MVPVSRAHGPQGTSLLVRGRTEPRRRFSLILADFCRFLPSRKRSIWETQLFAEPQIFAENRSWAFVPFAASGGKGPPVVFGGAAPPLPPFFVSLGLRSNLYGRSCRRPLVRILLSQTARRLTTNCPKGPKIEKNQSRLNCLVSLENLELPLAAGVRFGKLHS